jgi:hypothetical protein
MPQQYNGGRPKLEPTKEQRNDVRALASCGTAQDVIVRYPPKAQLPGQFPRP